ncbi:MAG UNVERIFIED_CONTAM: serine/threonine protein kinase [Planctomycetaceae bacterium]|jgi:serine/threonine protein kinase
MLNSLPEVELDAAWVTHLDHCNACWEMVGDLNAATGTTAFHRLPRRLECLEANLTGGRGNAAAMTSKDLPHGARLGPFRLLAPLGHGGMASVYLGIDERSGRRVAVKCLRPTRRSADFRSSLDREARLLSQLQHPNVVKLFEFNLDHDPPYLVLELADGGSLRNVLRRHTLTPRQSAKLIATVARAVHAAAANPGVLHLDLKPENILLVDGSDEQLPWIPKVADFGLCTSLHGAGRFADLLRQPQGTLAWMAPEQISGQSALVSRATDVYALGVILYELLTGMMPFRAAHDAELSGQICCCPPCPPRDLCPNVSRVLNWICLRCLQKEPQNRFQTAAELAKELDSIVNGTSLRRWPLRTVRLLSRPKLTRSLLRPMFWVCIGFILGVLIIRHRYSVLLPATPSSADIAEAAFSFQESILAHALRLGTKIQEADRAIEHFVLLPKASERSEGDRQVAMFLWNTALEPSKELLSEPHLVQILKDRDPQTLLLALSRNHGAGRGRPVCCGRKRLEVR